VFFIGTLLYITDNDSLNKHYGGYTPRQLRFTCRSRMSLQDRRQKIAPTKTKAEQREKACTKAHTHTHRKKKNSSREGAARVPRPFSLLCRLQSSLILQKKKMGKGRGLVDTKDARRQVAGGQRQQHTKKRECEEEKMSQHMATSAIRRRSNRQRCSGLPQHNDDTTDREPDEKSKTAQ
jgi:hypothetical protein